MSSHKGLTVHEHLKTMSIMSVPDYFLLIMECESKEEFVSSIVTIEFDMNYEDFLTTLKVKRYIATNGKLILQHVRTTRTSIIRFCSHNTILEDQSILSFSQLRI